MSKKPKSVKHPALAGLTFEQLTESFSALAARAAKKLAALDQT